MPRAKTQDRRARLLRDRSQQRVAEYVSKNWNTVRAAALDLGVEHNTLWRSMTGNNANGPSLAIVTVLAEHSGLTTDYFLGRGE